MPKLDIDYAAIIKKADDRRATLQELDAAIEDAPRHMHAITDAIEYFMRLSIMRNKLDQEGVSLLGDVSGAITEMHQAMQAVRAGMNMKRSWMHDRSPREVLTFGV